MASTGPGASAAPGSAMSAQAHPNGCIDDTAVGHHAYQCDGIVFDVEIPAKCSTPAACGLVVDAHGLTMSATMEDANTNMRALGAKFGFVVVQPNATPSPPLASWNAEHDDPILHTFLVNAISSLAVDPKRVHFSGFSDGGEASWRFLCKHADLFASVAPAAGGGCSFRGSDTPSREIPVLYMHGTQDGLVDFQSEAIPVRDAIVAGWNMGTGKVVEQGDGFVRTRWTSPKGTIFEFLQHDYQADSFILRGHCFPGSNDSGNAPGQLFPLACVPPNAFSWGEEVMKFFVANH
jgi:poly(3-hydroxybutyrate) depolymerase